MAVSEAKPILVGTGELYIYEFTGETIPDDATIETEEHSVGYCNNGFSIDYKPKKYNVKNRYGRIVKSFITDEELTCKTGIISWDLNKLALLSTAKIIKNSGRKKRTLIFSGGRSSKNVPVRFVHEEGGKHLRLTMIGQGGSGFGLDFTDKEVSINAEIQTIEYVKNSLAKFEQEL